MFYLIRKPADLLSRRVDFIEEGCESLTTPSKEQVLLPEKCWSENCTDSVFVGSVNRSLSPVVVENLDDQVKIIVQRHSSLLSGHPGRLKTFELISRNFTWPGMRAMIYDYVDSCSVCQQTKTRRQNLLGF